MYQQIGGDNLAPAQAVVGQAVSRGLWISSAESCTGGLIAFMLTSIAGVSAIYRGGMVAYANEAKRDLLQVDQALLAQYGAVSAPVAEAMVRGACAAFQTDYALSTTGIAGPGGATESKPVGLVYCPRHRYAVAISASSGRVRRS
jgi:PncC family amidohydrolase